MALPRHLTARVIAFAKKIALRDSQFRNPHSELHFERPRTADGEFAPQAEDVPDPATMQAAYGHQSSTLPNAGQAAGAAVGVGGTAAAALLLARRLRRK